MRIVNSENSKSNGETQKRRSSREWECESLEWHLNFHRVFKWRGTILLYLEKHIELSLNVLAINSLKRANFLRENECIQENWRDSPKKFFAGSKTNRPKECEQEKSSNCCEQKFAFYYLNNKKVSRNRTSCVKKNSDHLNRNMKMFILQYILQQIKEKTGILSFESYETEQIIEYANERSSEF